MLQACLYAERPIAGSSYGDRPSASRAVPPRFTLADLLAIGRRHWLQSRNDIRLSDHLLDDIGLSRADLAALSL